MLDEDGVDVRFEDLVDLVVCCDGVVDDDGVVIAVGVLVGGAALGAAGLGGATGVEAGFEMELRAALLDVLLAGGGGAGDADGAGGGFDGLSALDVGEDSTLEEDLALHCCCISLFASSVLWAVAV